MAQDQHPAVTRLVAVHLVLALAPALMGFVSIDARSLPVVWSLASIPLAQVMLIAIWVAMAARGAVFRHAIILLAAGAYLTIGTSVGQVLMLEQPRVSALGAAYAQNVTVFWVLLALMTLVLAGISRFVGRIRVVNEADLPVGEPRYRFSLLAMLATSTVIAVALALARLSQAESAMRPTRTSPVEYALAVVIFSLNILVMIWATLGPAHVKRRLTIVIFVSFLLGLLFAAGAGGVAYDVEPWWLFLSRVLVVLVPTIIVVGSLLYLRRNGFRLIPTTRSSPDSQSA